MATRNLQCPDYSFLAHPVKPQPKKQKPKQKKSHKNSGHSTQLTVCGICGAPAKQRKSAYGKFLGCSRFPVCVGTARSRTSKWKLPSAPAPASVLPAIQTT